MHHSLQTRTTRQPREGATAIMSYQSDLAKPAGDHLGDGLHCHKSGRTCIMCRMAPMTGSMYCKHCHGLVNQRRSNPAGALVDETARLGVGAVNTSARVGVAAVDTSARVGVAAVGTSANVAVASANVATRAAEFGIKAPLAVAAAVTDAVANVARYVAHVGMTDEEQAENIARYIRENHDYDENEIADIMEGILDPANVVDRLEMLGMALGDAITAPFMSASRASGARDGTLFTLPEIKGSGARIDCAVTPNAGAHAGPEPCGCLHCAVSATVQAAYPQSGARAAADSQAPARNASRAPGKASNADAERRKFDQRWGIDGGRSASSSGRATAEPAREQPGQRNAQNITEKYRQRASTDKSRQSGAKSQDDLRGTGLEYRCHNCSTNTFETAQCKTCGARVPSVYIEDALDARRPSAAAKFADTILEGVSSLDIGLGF